MGELTTTGYKLKTQNDWFAEEKQLYLDIDSAWNLDASTPDGLKIAHDAEVFSALDEVLQQSYDARDPAKASGYDLDVICSITGTTRSEGSYSTITTMTLTGVAGTPVPAGTRFESSTTGYRFTLDQQVTLNTDGVGSGSATCSTIGEIEADANSVTRIVDTVSGLVSATNTTAAVPGTAVESDGSLRLKRSASVGLAGNNQVDSMLGALFNVDSVRRVRIYENDTDSADVSDDNPYGLPANSISPIVDGGTDDDVAMAIYLKKSPGVILNQAGTAVSVVVTSPVSSIMTKNIKFSRPKYVNMVLVIKVKDDGTLPSQETLEPLIADAILEYSAGDLIPTEYGFKPDGFDIGENVPYSSMYTPINKVLGSYGNAYVDSMTLNGGTTNVTIDFNELSLWTTSNITVTIV